MSVEKQMKDADELASKPNEASKTRLIEMKLASNSKFEQIFEIDSKSINSAIDADGRINTIICFLKSIARLSWRAFWTSSGVVGHKDTIPIDARDDNKPPVSKA